MKRYSLLFMCIFVLQACALPVPLQVASWVADGVSILLTHKSITDHGISLLVQKDCSVFRGFTGNDFCIDDAPGTTYAAEETSTPSVPADGIPDQSDVDALAEFETAAGAPVGETSVVVLIPPREMYLKVVTTTPPASTNAKWDAPQPVETATAVAAFKTASAAGTDRVQEVYLAALRASGSVPANASWDAPRAVETATAVVAFKTAPGGLPAATPAARTDRVQEVYLAALRASGSVPATTMAELKTTAPPPAKAPLAVPSFREAIYLAAIKSSVTGSNTAWY